MLSLWAQINHKILYILILKTYNGMSLVYNLNDRKSIIKADQ